MGGVKKILSFLLFSYILLIFLIPISDPLDEQYDLENPLHQECAQRNYQNVDFLNVRNIQSYNKQLEKNNEFSALFYSSEKKIQLRFKGNVEIFHKNSITKQRWDNITPSSKRCYMGPYNPSDTLEEYHPNIPDNVQFKDPTEQDSLSGYNNFVIIRCHFYEIDFLKLKYSGHQRCKFILDKEKINVSWVAP